MLFIHNMLRAVDLHSVCAHITHHRNSIQKVVAVCGSPYVEAALTTLLVHENGPSKLATLNLSANLDNDDHQLYDTVLFLATQFTTLTACVLRANPSLANGQPYSFDLDALRALPHLAWLELSDGSFTSLQAASHLTYLSLETCNVKCGADCGFVSTGTPAESLRISTDKALEIPNSLARLTTLTCLEIHHADHGDVHVQFGWLSQLPSLRRICINVGVTVAEFPESLSTLSNLTSLYVRGWLSRVQIKFCVDWRAALKTRAGPSAIAP